MPDSSSLQLILLRLAAYLVFAPIIGGLLAGIDRRISARMQGRLGPPILQPFFDVKKLWGKEDVVVRRSQNFFLFYFFVFAVFTGALFFCGSDLLLVIFSLTLAGIFFILAAYKASSPYSFIGAEREMLQVVAYEPAVLMSAVGLYMVSGSFNVDRIAAYPGVATVLLPGIFVSLLFAIVIKLRKSPFDLSSSHHAHQELVRGITTEFSGRMLALVEVGHWYENVMVLGLVYLFFAAIPWLGLGVVALVFFGAILVDNSFARVKWHAAIRTTWAVTLVAGMGNLVLLNLLGSK